jgi:serine phosphatase RsbU (regulator of sigma subunit)
MGRYAHLDSQENEPPYMTNILRRVPPPIIDGVLVLAVAIGITISISVAPEPESREPDVIAYGLGVAIASLLFFRRRWPLGVLLGSSAILHVYYALDFPGFFPAVPIATPLYFAVAAGYMFWPLALSVVWVIGPLFYRLLADPEPILTVLNDTVRDGGFFAAVILLGIAVRSRRQYTAEVAERLQRAEAEGERVARELEVARLVQEQFLPSELPEMTGWQISTFYRSAREVGGDFYDFASLPNGKVGIAIGDVTDKGAPAALLMATTQGLLRADAPRLISPARVLERVNDILVPNTPSKMFVTCLYIVLDPGTGAIQFANAGHNLPYLATKDGVEELRATGLPLGLMPGISYDLMDGTLGRGARLLLHSDGIAEAHNTDRDMFGFPRLVKVVENCGPEESLIDATLGELERFTGPGWEQEDDITLVAIERSA